MCVVHNTCVCVTNEQIRFIYSGWHSLHSGPLTEWWWRWNRYVQTSKRKPFQGLLRTVSNIKEARWWWALPKTTVIMWNIIIPMFSGWFNYIWIFFVVYAYICYFILLISKKELGFSCSFFSKEKEHEKERKQIVDYNRIFTHLSLKASYRNNYR